MTPVLARAQDAVKHDDIEAMRKALVTTVRQTEKALGFTRRLIELARGEELSLGTHAVRELVEDAVASAVRPFERDGIELELRVPDDLRIRVQRTLFVQLMLNLLLNARKAMKDRRGSLTIAARRDNDVVEIDVCDEGIGLSPEMLDGVMNPFLAAEAEAEPGAGGGIGLGLRACRLIARQHDATLRALANEGPGCTFRLNWPAA
jgi:signal transduction histidine kinase